MPRPHLFVSVCPPARQGVGQASSERKNKHHPLVCSIENKSLLATAPVPSTGERTAPYPSLR
eukprot:scaffold168803_cov53-Attheya_sp.AAC.1